MPVDLAGTPYLVCEWCGDRRPVGLGHACPDLAGRKIIPPTGGSGVTTTRPVPLTYAPGYAPACRDCRHFARLKADAGECRYNPPTSRAQERWPWVAGADFCGRFELAVASPGDGLKRITEG